MTWRKPPVGRTAYYGETKSNIVYRRTLSPNGMHGASVFKDPHALAAERYKLIYYRAWPLGWIRHPGRRSNGRVLAAGSKP